MRRSKILQQSADTQCCQKILYFEYTPVSRKKEVFFKMTHFHEFLQIINSYRFIQIKSTNFQ